MNKLKIILLLITLALFTIPAFQAAAQDSTNEALSDQTTYNYKKAVKWFEKYYKKMDKEKEKEKEKDTVSINSKFFFSLLIDIATLIIIILLVYYPNNRKFESIFAFFMFNLLIFMLTFVLNKIKISMGAAFGLFAVFSMLRYRTEGISMKDMTYLFIFIAVGLISAIQLEIYELAIINGLIIVFTLLLDSNFLFKIERSKLIEYENIDLVKPEHYQQLLDDLRKRTGLNVHHFEIQNINFLKDSTEILIFYHEKAR